MWRVPSFARKETEFQQQPLPTSNQRPAARGTPSAATRRSRFRRWHQRCAIYTPCLQRAKAEDGRSPAARGEAGLPASLSAQTASLPPGHLVTAVLSLDSQASALPDSCLQQQISARPCPNVPYGQHKTHFL